MDVAAVANIDADVADRALLGLAKGQKVARKESARVLGDRQPLLGLLLRRARHLQIQRLHHVGDQATTVEPLFGRLPAGAIAAAELRLGHLYHGVAKRLRRVAERGEWLGFLGSHDSHRRAQHDGRAEHERQADWACR